MGNIWGVFIGIVFGSWLTPWLTELLAQWNEGGGAGVT